MSLEVCVCSDTHDSGVTQRRLVQELQKVYGSKEWTDGEVDLSEKFTSKNWIIEDGLSFDGNLCGSWVVLEESERLVGILQ